VGGVVTWRPERPCGADPLGADDRPTDRRTTHDWPAWPCR